MTDYPSPFIVRPPSGMIGPFFPGSMWAEMASSVGNTSSNAPGGSQAYYVPVEVPFPVTIYQAIARNGSVVSGNLDIALYDEQLNKLVGTGSTAQAGTNTLQVFNITDTPISRGTYYCGFAIDNGTGTLHTLGAAVPGQAAQGCGVQVANAVYPLPNPATFPGGAAGATLVPVFGFAYTSTPP
jgi:hypothetical protein